MRIGIYLEIIPSKSNISKVFSTRNFHESKLRSKKSINWMIDNLLKRLHTFSHEWNGKSHNVEWLRVTTKPETFFRYRRDFREFALSLYSTARSINKGTLWRRNPDPDRSNSSIQYRRFTPPLFYRRVYAYATAQLVPRLTITRLRTERTSVYVARPRPPSPPPRPDKTPFSTDEICETGEGGSDRLAG